MPLCNWFIILLINMKSNHFIIFILILVLYRGQALIHVRDSHFSSILSPPNCGAVNNQGVCIKCVPGFYLNLGSCNIINPYCLTYLSNGICTSCSVGFALQGTTCIWSQSTSLRLLTSSILKTMTFIIVIFLHDTSKQWEYF